MPAEHMVPAHRGTHARNHMPGNHMAMTGKELFAKSSPILFGVRLVQRHDVPGSDGPDLAGRVRRAHGACADFVGLDYAGTTRLESLEAVLCALTAPTLPAASADPAVPSASSPSCGKTGLCLFSGEEFAGDVFGNRKTDLAALVERHAHKLPLLVASPDKTLLAALEKRFPHLATAHVLAAPCACASMQEEAGDRTEAPGTDKEKGKDRDRADVEGLGEGTARCVLSRDLASGCRLCGLRNMGVYALVTGSFTRQDIVRMSLDGADAFLLDDAADLETVAVSVRRKG